MSDSLIPAFLLSDVSESLKSFTKNDQCEQIAHVAHQKWANRLFFWANRLFSHFFAKNERFAQKPDEQIPSPDFFRTAWAIEFNCLQCHIIFIEFDINKVLWTNSFKMTKKIMFLCKNVFNPFNTGQYW